MRYCLACGKVLYPKRFACGAKEGPAMFSRRVVCDRRCRANAQRKPIEQRFWSKVNKRGPRRAGQSGRCWNWTGATIAQGYGQLGDGKGALVLAHRLSWRIFHDREIPKGLEICHHCDTPGCVRPTHLFLGTHSDNRLDAVKKDRVRFCRGEQSHLHKLKTPQVISIRDMRDRGVSGPEVARLFGISSSQVYRIARRESWSHLTQEKST